MVRQNIFEILDSKYNIPKEVGKIIKLFCETGFQTGYDGILHIEQLVDNFCLFYWKQRNSYLNCQEIREDLGIDYQTLQPESMSKEFIITLLEYFLNMLNLLATKNPYTHFQLNQGYFILKQNILLLLDHLNHEQLIIEQEEKTLVIPKNPVATAVAEISSPNTAFSILKYNHASFKGDLEGKKHLLLSIYSEYEPIFKSSIENYNDFLDKVNALFNTLDIRHNNRTRKDNKNHVIDISAKELEEWYDELYQLMLFCILINDNIERKRKIKDFLKTLKVKK